MPNSMKDIEKNIDSGMDEPSLKDSFRPLKYGELPGGGGEMAAAMHQQDAAEKTGIFDPKYDDLPGISQQRMNVLRGRDNEDDGDGTDENAGWTPNQ